MCPRPYTQHQLCPSHSWFASGWSQMKHRVALAILRPNFAAKVKGGVYRNLKACAWAMGPRDCIHILLILNDTQQHYDTTVSLSWGPSEYIQKFDSMHGHCDCVTGCHPALNLKVGKKNYAHMDKWTIGLGNQAPDTAKCSQSGQNLARTWLEVGKKNPFIQPSTWSKMWGCLAYACFLCATLNTLASYIFC